MDGYFEILDNGREYSNFNYSIYDMYNKFNCIPM